MKVTTLNINDVLNLSFFDDKKDEDTILPIGFDRLRSTDVFSQIDNALNFELKRNTFYKAIINSPEFLRLKNVSFLGAIDYSPLSSNSNRYTHSIDVAKLALYVCNLRNYGKEETTHIVTAALLHDIGHAPLSHSMESEFYKKFGINHHIASEQIINGQSPNNSLMKIISKRVDKNLVIDLINQQSNDHFSDIFNSKINVDTIDGIHKSLTSRNRTSPFNKYFVARAAFDFESDSEQIKELDNFWRKKDFVYKHIITSGIGAVADYISKEYFHDNQERIDESLFFKDEEKLFSGRSPIFKNFKSKLRSLYRTSTSDEIESKYYKSFTTEIIERNYSIDEHIENDEDFIAKRYQYKKTKKQKNIYYTIKENDKHLPLIDKQLKLLYSNEEYLSGKVDHLYKGNIGKNKKRIS